MSHVPPTAPTPLAAPPSHRLGATWPVLAIAAWVGVLAGFLIAVPRCEMAFRDFGVALPTSSIAAINAARWLRGSGPGMVIPGVIIAAAPVIVAFIVSFATNASGNPRAAKTLFRVLFVMAAALLLGLAVTMAIPMVGLYRATVAGGV